MSVVATKIGTHSKMLIQVTLVLVASVMIFYNRPIPLFSNVVFQSITILLLFVFGIYIDPSIAILLTCILNIALVNNYRKMQRQV